MVKYTVYYDAPTKNEDRESERCDTITKENIISED